MTTPLPVWVRLPEPEIVEEIVGLSEWSKVRFALSVMLPVIEPVVPPLPI